MRWTGRRVIVGVFSFLGLRVQPGIFRSQAFVVVVKNFGEGVNCALVHCKRGVVLMFSNCCVLGCPFNLLFIEEC